MELNPGFVEPTPSYFGERVRTSLDESSANCDLTLRSVDGETVRVIRHILMISSPYFQSLLALTFSGEVFVSVNMKELEQVLDFIYTDDCNILEIIGKDTLGLMACKEAKSLLTLTAVAVDFKMERMAERCIATFKLFMNRRPNISCAAYEHLREWNDGNNWTDDVCENVLSLAAHYPVKSLFETTHLTCGYACGVLHLSERTAFKFFSGLLDELAIEDGKIAFEALLVWVSNGTALRTSRGKRLHSSTTTVRVDMATMRIVDERLAIGKQIAPLFDLSTFDAHFLSEEVEGCGLLGETYIKDAFKAVMLTQAKNIRRLQSEGSRGQKER